MSINLATRASTGLATLATLAALVLLAAPVGAQGLEDDFEAGAFDMAAPPPMPTPPPAFNAQPAPPPSATGAALSPLPVPNAAASNSQSDVDASFLERLSKVQKQLQLRTAERELLKLESEVQELQSTLEDSDISLDEIGVGKVAIDRDVSEFDPIVIRVRGVGGSLVARVRTAFQTEVTVGPGDSIPGGYIVRSVSRNGVDVITPKGKSKQLAFGTGSNGGLPPSEAQKAASAALASGGQLGALPLPGPDLGASSQPLSGF